MPRDVVVFIGASCLGVGAGEGRCWSLNELSIYRYLVQGTMYKGSATGSMLPGGATGAAVLLAT